jgi:hypothetical protein
MPSTADVEIDLGLVPDLVAEDALIQARPDGPSKYDAEVDIVNRTCRRLRDLQPELDALDDDTLYDLVAHALAERNP